MILARFEAERLRVIGHSKTAQKGHDIVCAAVSALTQALYYGLSEVIRVDVTWESWDYGDFDVIWKEETLRPEGRALVATIQGSLFAIASRHPDALAVEIVAK